MLAAFQGEAHMPKKLYIVNLTDAERQQLLELQDRAVVESVAYVKKLNR